MKTFLVISFLTGCFGFFPISVNAASVPEKLPSAAGDGSYTIEDKIEADDIKILGSRDVAALSDDKVLEAFIDALVEIEATKTFHTTNGFTPKEYKKYKALLKYRMHLLLEIHRRKIEVPATLY